MKKKLLSAFVVIAMICTMLSGLSITASAAQTSTETWTKLTTAHTNQWLGENGKTYYYYVTEDTTLTAKTAGYSGIGIRGTVYIYVPSGVILTLNGAAGNGKTGGGAGILLPEGTTLYLIGNGTAVANGGAAAAGSKGVDGEDGSITVKSTTSGSYYGGNGGAGGAGGGGAGAGVGTTGGTGGDGGAGGKGDGGAINSDHTNRTGGSNGKKGGAGAAMGTLYTQSTLKLTAKGGSASGTRGAAGNAGKSVYDSGSGWANNHTAGGGGGGGGGGSGSAANNIGTGGAGGGGGGGGSGAYVLYKTGTAAYYYAKADGGYGGYGYKNGANGTGQNSTTLYRYNNKNATTIATAGDCLYKSGGGWFRWCHRACEHIKVCKTRFPLVLHRLLHRHEQ